MRINFKKIIVIFVILGFMLTLTPKSFALANENFSIRLNADTFMDLDLEGNKMGQKQSSNSTVLINRLDFNSPNIVIDGVVTYKNNTEKPFSLSGKIKRSQNSSKTVIGSLNDTLGNFEVIYFAIDKEPDGKPIYNKEKLSKIKNNKKTVLKLYLLEKGTRNFTVLEVFNPKFINEDDFFNDFANLETAEYQEDCWYTKILKPIKAEKALLDKLPSKKIALDELDKNISLQSGDISITALHNNYTYGYYQFVLNVFGGYIYQDFIVKFYVEGPTELDASGGVFTTKMYVYDEETWSYDYPQENYDDTLTSIGTYDDTKIDAYTDPGDVFRYVLWDGQYYRKGTLDVSVSWSYTLPYTGISFAVSYSSSKKYTSEDMKTFDNSGSTKVRQCGVTWAEGTILQDVGDTFDTIFAVGHYGSPGTKKFHVRWTYDVSNAHDPYWGGIKTKTLELSYYSK